MICQGYNEHNAATEVVEMVINNSLAQCKNSLFMVPYVEVLHGINFERTARNCDYQLIDGKLVIFYN